ncbi:MAG: hypothetical protein CK425_02320 [Parachlamydia sp.]|nr:MAG: hypothetical protein CK425_02320 [Parachlamydia sp.]
MTSDTLRVIGEELFGPWGWQTKLAKALRVDGSTVRRWISGATAIPGPAEVALELLLLSHQTHANSQSQSTKTLRRKKVHLN